MPLIRRAAPGWSASRTGSTSARRRLRLKRDSPLLGSSQIGSCRVLQIWAVSLRSKINRGRTSAGSGALGTRDRRVRKLANPRRWLPRARCSSRVSARSEAVWPVTTRLHGRAWACSSSAPYRHCRAAASFMGGATAWIQGSQQALSACSLHQAISSSACPADPGRQRWSPCQIESSQWCRRCRPSSSPSRAIESCPPETANSSEAPSGSRPGWRSRWRCSLRCDRLQAWASS